MWHVQIRVRWPGRRSSTASPESVEESQRRSGSARLRRTRLALGTRRLRTAADGATESISFFCSPFLLPSPSLSHPLLPMSSTALLTPFDTLTGLPLASQSDATIMLGPALVGTVLNLLFLGMALSYVLDYMLNSAQFTVDSLLKKTLLGTISTLALIQAGSVPLALQSPRWQPLCPTCRRRARTDDAVRSAVGTASRAPSSGITRPRRGAAFSTSPASAGSRPSCLCRQGCKVCSSRHTSAGSRALYVTLITSNAQVVAHRMGHACSAHVEAGHSRHVSCTSRLDHPHG